MRNGASLNCSNQWLLLNHAAFIYFTHNNTQTLIICIKATHISLKIAQLDDTSESRLFPTWTLVMFSCYSGSKNATNSKCFQSSITCSHSVWWLKRRYVVDQIHSYLQVSDVRSISHRNYITSDSTTVNFYRVRQKNNTIIKFIQEWIEISIKIFIWIRKYG